ncbi:hypothetical protein [Polaromonas sp. CG_9.11]|uniref:hypothetical protein n=1 Tax=Polaromonas sp. CG_9.11 TaxID=2787730 RepID=UPI001A27B20F|nr:hypothetical protein [Polaromonas sp. CG_9.11]MBG6076207.1 putative membrane protein YdjX (TVP38/TMEM64 family) [Polaromonas sp. CG_9.11]
MRPIVKPGRGWVPASPQSLQCWSIVTSASGMLLTLDSRHQAQPLSTAVGFFAIYGAAAALSIPGAMILTLAAGAIFGLGLAPERPD